MQKMLFLVLCLAPCFLTAQTVPDSVVLRRVDSLIQISRTLTGEQAFDKALEVGAAAETLALEKLGRESAAYGSCSFNRGRINYFKGDYPEAEKWYLEALAITEKVLGKEHPSYAPRLNNLAILYKNTGKYEQARQRYFEVKAIREKVLGKEHPDYASTLNSIAILYTTMGNYKEAEPFYLENLFIREKTLGKEHPQYAVSLYNLALHYDDIGNLEKAESLHLQANAIWKKVLGKEHPDYASSLNGLAILYEKMGNYEKAASLHLESMAIRGKALGTEDPDYAASLNGLANTYVVMGNYEEAESLFLEAIKIKEKILGKEHPSYALGLNNLAVLYSKMGNYEKAEALLLEVNTIKEKVFGKEHPDYALSLNNLAMLYWTIGSYEKAEPFYYQVKTINEKVFGKDHAEYASILVNLGLLYDDLGQYEKAESLYLEALAIKEKTLGREHPGYALSQNNLAILYMTIGQYEKAEPLYLQSMAIREKALGKQHPQYALSLYNLANLYRDMGLSEKAEPPYIECALANQSQLEKAMRHLSERELGSYLKKFSEIQDQTLSFVQLTANKKVAAACFDNSLFYKGFLLQNAGQIKRMSLSNPAATENFNLLRSCERRLSAQYAQPIADRDNTVVAILEAKVNDLEKELARTVAGFGQAMQQIKWQEVQAALKPGEAAVEFVSYRYYQKKQTDSTMYAALIVLPLPAGASAEAGRAEMLQFIPLFEEREIAALFKNKGARKSDYVNTLYTNSAQTTGKQKSLYQAIWQPLETALAGAKTVYFSPAGLLHRINFNAIASQGGKPLADRLHLVQLGSTRQIVLPQPEVNAAPSPEAWLFGGINYEPDSLNHAPALVPQDYSRTRGGLDFEDVDSTLRGGTWGYLPWTEKEVNSLQTILKQAGLRPVLNKGSEGSEEAFKSIGAAGASPRVLHLATHGFFFPDPKRLPQQAGTGESAFKRAEHPMIRSGLILAGGNYAWKTGKPYRPDREDGIITAYEISQMNLSNTELVVLSACETGLGDIEGNEGVYGLQRALKIAGANYIVMSLWQVPDAQTQELMTVFYTNWLSRNMPIPQAFDAAQKAMREKYEHPFFWAGFILLR